MEQTEQREETKTSLSPAAVDTLKQIQATRMANLRKRMAMNNRAYKSGEKAKLCGWARLSPFCDEISEKFFFAGFDGIPWIKALRGEFDS